MPLDTSSYSLALLRLDGRRWNELRRLHGQISTQSAADGSSFLEMGNTKVICTVSGPEEPSRRQLQTSGKDEARIEVDINVAAFAGVDRRRRARADKRTQEMAHTIEQTFSTALLTHLYPGSVLHVALHVLASDGSLLAALINAATLALIDAGVPMGDYVAACSAGSAASHASGDDGSADPLLDLSSVEETELPGLTIATSGASGGIVGFVLETRVQAARVEGMVKMAVEGCAQVRKTLDAIVREHGKRMLNSAP